MLRALDHAGLGAPAIFAFACGWKMTRVSLVGSAGSASGSVPAAPGAWPFTRGSHFTLRQLSRTRTTSHPTPTRSDCSLRWQSVGLNANQVIDVEDEVRRFLLEFADRERVTDACKSTCSSRPHRAFSPDCGREPAKHGWQSHRGTFPWTTSPTQMHKGYHGIHILAHETSTRRRASAPSAGK